MKKSVSLITGALLLLLAALTAKPVLIAPPELRPSPAAGQFDTGRAMGRLQRILGDQRPHPVDSAANDAVHARLIAELRAIGLDPVVTDDMVCNGSGRSRTVGCARVRNVLATIGPARGDHVLAASHYDSSPAGPGAADDGIGMAVMLESAALLHGKTLDRPVTFLFDEGEEAGLLGARAFLERNPLADRVAALVNFEARGVSGPAMMFETSHPNGAAIAHFARSSERPFANSLATDFARLIPNSTDVEVLKERDWTILNFAIIGNESRYHSDGDTLAALDRRSVQHMGDQGLAAIASLAAGPVERAQGETVYADLLGRQLLVLPLPAALAGLAALLGATLWTGWRRRNGLGTAAAAVLLALAGAAAVTFVAQWLVGLMRPGEFWRAYPIGISSAVAASALLAAGGVLLWAARALSADRLRAAYWLIFLLLGAGASLVASGAVIFFLVPPLAALAGMAGERRWPGAERIGGIVAAILLFVSLAPLLALMEVLLDYHAAWIFAPLTALLLLPFLIEMLPLLAAAPRRIVGGGLAAAALACWALAALLPAYSDERRQRFGLEYAWDAKNGARWAVVNDGAALPERFQAIGGWQRGKLPWSARERWWRPAEGKTSVPQVECLSETRTERGRMVSLRLRPKGADTVLLRLPPEAQVRAVRAGASQRSMGRGRAKDPYFVRCHGRSCDGLRIDLLLGQPGPVEAMVIGLRSGLPDAAAPLVAARPARSAPQYAPDSTIGMARVRL
ncbi:M28 family peptidase [Sphingomonas sp. LY54]|uniref:M28 family peptidase n=1 Tax=Sphingomonas sp. LY54 TaxID=3095343 RepID=UPI002D76EF98|nr:M28 family peptidase [Sphingomonas sp. LY54]WRP28803.1 M28 family peptidase [Sphingomonas sp. LY54]